VRGHHTMRQPYVMLFHYMLVSAVSEAVDRGQIRPMEIVFDEQTVFRPAIVAEYQGLRDEELSHPKRLAVMPLLPGFRDDREFVILQAADLLAGDIRLTAENSPDNPPFVGELCRNI